MQQHYGRIGIIGLKKDTFLSLKDLKGHFDQKYSFKGLFEIKDACTYTGSKAFIIFSTVCDYHGMLN